MKGFWLSLMFLKPIFTFTYTIYVYFTGLLLMPIAKAYIFKQNTKKYLHG